MVRHGLRESQGRVNNDRLMETEIWCLSSSSVGKGLRKGTTASASTSVWEKAAPPALALIRHFSSSHLSLVPFKLLPHNWNSEEVRLSKPVLRPFNRNCLGLQKLFLYSVSIPTGF